MICPWCGAEVAQAKYCENCGSALPEGETGLIDGAQQSVGSQASSVQSSSFFVSSPYAAEPVSQMPDFNAVPNGFQPQEAYVQQQAQAVPMQDGYAQQHIAPPQQAYEWQQAQDALPQQAGEWQQAQAVAPQAYDQQQAQAFAPQAYDQQQAQAVAPQAYDRQQAQAIPFQSEIASYNVAPASASFDVAATAIPYDIGSSVPPVYDASSNGMPAVDSYSAVLDAAIPVVPVNDSYENSYGSAPVAASFDSVPFQESIPPSYDPAPAQMQASSSYDSVPAQAPVSASYDPAPPDATAMMQPAPYAAGEQGRPTAPSAATPADQALNQSGAYGSSAAANVAPATAFGLAIAGLILSLLGVPCVLGVILCIVALVLNSRYNKSGMLNRHKTSTLVLSIIGLVAGLVAVVLSALMLFGIVNAASIVPGEFADPASSSESAPSEGEGSESEQAESQAFAGSWKLVGMQEGDDVYTEEQISAMESVGLTVELNLSEQGGFDLVLFGESMEGTWESDSDTHATCTLEDEAVDLELVDGKLQVKQGESMLIFARAS